MEVRVLRKKSKSANVTLNHIHYNKPMEDKNLPLTIFQNLMMELTMNVNQSFKDNMQDLSDIVYDHIKNAEYDTISLPNSFGDSFIKWWGRHLTSEVEILDVLQQEFYEFKEKNLDRFSLVEKYCYGELTELESAFIFKSPIGEFDAGQIYHGEFDESLLGIILRNLALEDQVILLPNSEWTDTDSYWDNSPDY